MGITHESAATIYKLSMEKEVCADWYGLHICMPAAARYQAAGNAIVRVRTFPAGAVLGVWVYLQGERVGGKWHTINDQ